MESMSRWLLAALLVVSGCAFSLDGPDPKRPRNQPPTCDTSKNLVVLDGVMAAALGVATLGLVSSDDPAIAVLPLSLGALYVGGMVAGNRSVERCKAAMSAWDGAREQLVVDETGDADLEPDRAARPAAPSPPRDAQPQPSAEPRAPAAQPASLPPAQPAATPPARPAPAPTPASDDWAEFWKEVP